MPWSIAIPAVAALAGSAISADASRSAGNKQADAARRAGEVELEMSERNVELQKPWRDAGIGALGQLSDLTKPGGDFMRDFTMADFQKDPGYQFRLTEGMRGLESSAAARGGALSGGALKDLAQYGQGFASNEYSNAYNRFNADRDRRFNRLSGIAGTGQTATQQLVNQGGETAARMGEYGLQAANARASGYVGQANAINQGLGTIGNWFQYNQQPGGYTAPNMFGNYSNPGGETANYRGADLPYGLRGGG